MNTAPETRTSPLETLWHRYREQLNACREACSEETVHDLRVAMRRLSTGFAFTHRLTRDAWALKMSRVFKKQVSRLADLRDTQMMRETATLACVRLPQLKPLVKHLSRREKYQVYSLRKRLASFRTHGVARGLAKTRIRLEALGEDAFTQKTYGAVDRAYRKVHKRLASLDPRSVASLHRTRIAFRKFRYMLEAIQPQFPTLIPAELLSGLPRYQARMGLIQDTEVFLQAIAAMRPQDTSLREAERHFARRRARLITTFMKHRDDLHAFWRASPEADFPWAPAREATAASKPAVRRSRAERPSRRSPRHTPRRADHRTRNGRSSGARPRADRTPDR